MKRIKAPGIAAAMVKADRIRTQALAEVEDRRRSTEPPSEEARRRRPPLGAADVVAVFASRAHAVEDALVVQAACLQRALA